MCVEALCIDCNWSMAGPFAPLVLILASLGALLGWLAFALSGLPDFLQGLSEDLGFAGTSAGGAAYNTADDIGTGVAQGGLGTANDPPPPAPESPTRVPPPEAPPSRGVGGWFYDVVGHDLSNLGRQ